MDNLRLLTLNYTKLIGCPENFPEGLRFLRCLGFPSKSIPFDLPLEKLVYLDLRYSKLEHVWTGDKVLLSLKILDLSHSKKLIRTPNFRGLPNLEKLILEGCDSLVHICDTIGSLRSLFFLNLSYCKSLQKYPNIRMLNSLQWLVFDGCSIFESSNVVVDTNEITRKPSSYTIRDQVMKWYTFIQRFVPKPTLKNPQRSVLFPHSLVRLSLQSCNLSDDNFPLDFSQLSMMEILDLSINNFQILPPSISKLGMLKTLILGGCNDLISISMPKTVSILSLYWCRSLERIKCHSAHLETPYVDLCGCPKLVEVEDMFKLELMDKVNQEVVDILGLRYHKFNENIGLLYTCVFDGKLHLEENTHQVLYEFGIYSTYLLFEEIPRSSIDGSYSGSSSVSFVVPSNHTLRLRGINIYCVYDYPPDDPDINYRGLSIVISNKTKDLRWVYFPVIVGSTENREDNLVWLSHWMFGSQIVCGDEIEVSTVVSSPYPTKFGKEVHVKFVWCEEEEPINVVGIIGGDLASFHFVNERVFLLGQVNVISRGFCRNMSHASDLTIQDLDKWIKQRGPKRIARHS